MGVQDPDRSSDVRDWRRVTCDTIVAADDLHLAIVPVLLGPGERLFDNLEGFERAYECVELVSSPSVAHVRFARRRDQLGRIIPIRSELDEFAMLRASYLQRRGRKGAGHAHHSQ